MEKSKRNRAATTQRIVEALEQVLAERGLEGVGINLVAEKAGVSKVLVYRYFGGLEGLLEYYVRMGRLFPHYSPALLEQIQPVQQADLAPIWSGQALQLFRQLRSSKAAREVLKATVKENDPLADVISQAQDAELTNLVNQLSFVQGSDHQATSAVVLGALSYLTILAQNNRPMIGLDLRDESDWQRIENAVKTIYKAMGRLIDTPIATATPNPASLAVSTW
jgi:AcrR family transcriptional regulator